eukprot:CAMPEP_0114567198 /NCGR_PEP_ID=MMETSP0114-20121206/15341_1 /TAXON_ID=31324 /ORGANISM="Goniomonas sp, Strain m" /LENGTH=69 /DNA_ID=CAMNT_0001753747 /DNA_START=266 /DNA_END=475 /DNA_ORIENTATION=-
MTGAQSLCRAPLPGTHSAASLDVMIPPQYRQGVPSSTVIGLGVFGTRGWAGLAFLEDDTEAPSPSCSEL